jgi:hypothetical protein
MRETKSSPVLVLLAWVFVGIPLTWGVYNTVRNSMKLFQKPAPTHVQLTESHTES